MSDEEIILGVKESAQKISDLVIQTIKDLHFFKWSQLVDGFVKTKTITTKRRWNNTNTLKKKRDLELKEISIVDRVKPYYAYLTAPDQASRNMCIEYAWGVLRKQIEQGFTRETLPENSHITAREKFEYTFKMICEKFEKEIINGIATNKSAKITQLKRG